MLANHINAPHTHNVCQTSGAIILEQFNTAHSYYKQWQYFYTKT